MTPSVPDADRSPEALYQQGMAHYQRREWPAALDRFRQLQEIQPGRPGLDSLIDEVSWFLQLEQVDPDAARPDAREQVEPGRPRPGLRWTVPALLVLAVLVVLVLWQGWIPGLNLGRNLEREALYNRGQAALAVGDYEGARDAFTELANTAPNSPEAQDGLERAARLEELASAYDAAQAAIDAQDWDAAENRLRAVVLVDPAYGEASQQLAFVQSQRELSELFKAGVGAYDQGDYLQAIELLERLTETDATYQRDALRELLFVLYLSEGRTQLAKLDASSDDIRQAIARFGKALALRPRNVQAAEESRLANQFLAAKQALEREDWSPAETQLQAILDQRPGYADGQAQELYYHLLVQRADQERATGRIAAAQARYQQALALAVADPSQAEAGLQALEALYTPTPTATPTATPQPQPTPFVEIQSDTLNVRLGPGTDYPVVGQVILSDRLALVGRNEAGDWLVVCCVDGQPGWVAARLAVTDADILLLPVGMAPTQVPTATATFTATPSATPVPPPTTSPPSSPSEPDRPRPTATPTPPPR